MAKRANSDVREAIKKGGLYQWEIAEKYGCSEVTFIRKLRRELPDTEKQKIYAIIEELVKEREIA